MLARAKRMIQSITPGIGRALLTSIGILLLALPVTGDTPPESFKKLKNRLTADGFNRDEILALYRQSEVRFDSRSVGLFFIHSESKLNYGQFATPKSISKAQKYQQTHIEPLARTEAEFGVDKDVITAIILVETRLGERLGKSLVFNTLSTMAALSDDTARKHLWSLLPEERRLPKEKYEKKADRKSGWAYNELKALLNYTLNAGIDPTAIRGSYAGAMGICQFMPSNISRLAADGNGDGRVDLFNHEDAIASVAKYLRHHGWKSGQGYEKAYKVIRRYNNSRPYAETILTIAKLLKNSAE